MAMAARIRSVVGARGVVRGGVALWHACDIVEARGGDACILMHPCGVFEVCWWRALPVCLWVRILAVFVVRVVCGNHVARGGGVLL
ncbi:hypothetical protein GCM10023262_11690 [Bartonella pachyuromydis]|uniref:Uncharacterized protein n=1 Tax=Bartonella pachyuromydis TaxID=931097 RepID=A0ABP8VKQ6_9HYPH